MTKQYNIKDLLILVIIIILFGMINFYHLGSLKTSGMWFGDRDHKNVTLTFATQQSLSEINILACILSGSYQLSAVNQHNNSVKLVDIDGLKDNLPIGCQWQKINIASDDLYKSLSLNIIRQSSNIVKVVLLDKRKTPLVNYSISGDVEDDLDDVHNVFWQKQVSSPNYAYSAPIFDENSYAWMAYRYLQKQPVFNLSHPQLGILLTSLGIKFFGMNPFGWRFMACFSGLLLLAIVYLFGRELFNSRRWGVVAALLFGCEFMRFTISRLSVIEPFVTLFLVLEYFFLYRYAKFRRNTPLIAYRQLFYSMVFLGLAASSKSIGLFSLLGVLIVVGYCELHKVGSENIEGIPRARVFIALGVVVGAIYVFSYVPFMIMSRQTELFSCFISLQHLMWVVQTQLTVVSDHGLAWWQWALDIPYSIYFWMSSSTPASSSIVLMGNPIIWWSSIAAIPLLLFIWVKDKNFVSGVILLAFLSQYLPYLLVNRQMYIYYFYSATPFIVLAITFLFQKIWDLGSQFYRVLISCYLVTCMVLFILFYPVLSGVLVNRGYVFHNLLWFKSWWF